MAYLLADEESQDMPFYEDAKIYYEESMDYKDGSADFEAYYEQKCEKDARANGARESTWFFNMIDSYADIY